MVGILGLVLLTQTPLQVAAHPAKLGVRAWLPDTVLPVGAPARVYVELEDSGYLALLHVEPSGRIRVLYPEHPNDPAFVPGGAAFVVGGISDSTTFRVVAPGTGTLLAVRSWTPLDFAGLVEGNRPIASGSAQACVNGNTVVAEVFDELEAEQVAIEAERAVHVLHVDHGVIEGELTGGGRRNCRNGLRRGFAGGLFGGFLRWLRSLFCF